MSPQHFLSYFPQSFLVTFHDSIKDNRKVTPWKIDSPVPVGHGVFFSPNGCSQMRRKTHLTQINTLFADFDFKSAVVTGDMKPDYKQFMLDLDDLPTPTFVIESGNGWHVYWLLDEPIMVNDENRNSVIASVEAIQRTIHLQYGSDKSGIECVHLLRVPGYEHKKMPEHPFMVQVVEDNGDTTYTLEELSRLIPPTEKEVVEYAVGSTESSSYLEQVVVDVWKEKGIDVSINKEGNIFNGSDVWGTWINREGGFIATRSTDFPAQGNATTYTASVLGISTKEAYKRLISLYGEDVVVGSAKKVVSEVVIDCPEREQYLNHRAEGNWDNPDWKKRLEQLRKIYVANFYKYVAMENPHLLFEIGEDKSYWNYNDEEGVYNGVNFSTVRGLVIRMLIDEGLELEATEATAKNILAKYRSVYSLRGATFDSFVSDDNYFHVSNGWLNTKTRELTPHSPSRLSLHKSKVLYNPNAKGVIYNKMLDQDYRLPKDAVRVIDQFSGYILTHRVDQQKMLVFEGAPGCGKSTLPRIWLDLLGSKATTASLTSLSSSEVRFMGGNFVNKNFCFFDEANPKTENINEYFMSMADQQTIRVERKGIQGVETPRYTMKVVLSLNKMPYHQPEGFRRRYRHILFERSFTDEETEDVDILQKIISSEDELSAVLNRMLDGLDDLRKMGKFTIIAGEEDRKREHTIAADNMSEFLDTCFEPVYDDIVRYSFQELKEAYQEMFPTSFNRQLSTASFNKEILNPRLPEFRHIRKDVGRGGKCRGYTGLRLKPGYVLGQVSRNNEDKYIIQYDKFSASDDSF